MCGAIFLCKKFYHRISESIVTVPVSKFSKILSCFIDFNYKGVIVNSDASFGVRMPDTQSLRISFRGKPLIVTEHAITRFRERGGKRFDFCSVQFILDTIDQLLTNAAEDTSAPSTETLLNQKLNPGITWIINGWRFVIKEERDTALLVTVLR